MRPERAYSYILRCADGTFYTGWTSDVTARVKNHNAGKGAKYTRGRGPVELVYYEERVNKAEACRREWELKKLTRKQKEELISAWQEAPEV
jgi:putative endonuclease